MGSDVPSAIDGIRKRPAMYIGDVADPRLAFEEILSNAFDEYLAGRAHAIEVTVHADQSVTIGDDGGGAPRATVEGALSSPHDLATFDDHRPHVHLSDHLRGAGMCVVSALCARFEIETTHDGETHRWAHERGVPLGPITTEPSIAPTGTRVQMHFDPSIFRSIELPRMGLIARLEELTDLSPGLRIVLRDERYEIAAPARGILRRVRGRHPIELLASVGDTRVHAALSWRSDYDANTEPRIESFVNWHRTIDHGTHVTGMLDGLAIVEREIGCKRPLRERLDACVAVITPDVVWGSPTRDQQRSPALRPIVRDVIHRELSAYLAQHPDVASALVARRFRPE